MLSKGAKQIGHEAFEQAHKGQPARYDDLKLILPDRLEDMVRNDIGRDNDIGWRFRLDVAKVSVELRAYRPGADDRNVDAQRFKFMVETFRPAV